jgi:hypothetical protein
MIIGYGVRDRLQRPLRQGWETSEYPWGGPSQRAVWTCEKEATAEEVAGRFPSSSGAHVVPVRLEYK